MSPVQAQRVKETLVKQRDKIRELRAEIEATEQATEYMLNALLLKLGGSVTITPQEAVETTKYLFDSQEGRDGSITVRAVPKGDA